MSKNDALEVIMERLGNPGSDRFRRVLEELMTPEQAQMAEALPGTPQEVADKTGIALDSVNDGLDDLFFKGAVFPRGDFKERSYYRLARSDGQLHDATMATLKLDVEKDRPFFEAWWDFKINEWYPNSAKGMKERGKPGLRLVPAYNSIKDLEDILPYENYPEILKAQKRIAVTPCPCRLNTLSMGEECEIHDEVTHPACLQFGRSADYVIERGSGTELTLAEALELNDAMEESGLLHWWSNSKNITQLKFGCNCCRDCCASLVPLDQAGLPIGLSWEKTRYVAYTSQEDCSGCQECLDRCPFEAIDMERPEGSKKYKAVVDSEKCFGCGVCVVGCKDEALKMKMVRPPDHIPEDVPVRHI